MFCGELSPWSPWHEDRLQLWSEIFLHEKQKTIYNVSGEIYFEEEAALGGYLYYSGPQCILSDSLLPLDCTSRFIIRTLYSKVNANA